jgi:hypothetical protein
MLQGTTCSSDTWDVRSCCRQQKVRTIWGILCHSLNSLKCYFHLSETWDKRFWPYKRSVNSITSRRWNAYFPARPYRPMSLTELAHLKSPPFCISTHRQNDCLWHACVSLQHGPPNVLWRTAPSVVVGWLADRTLEKEHLTAQITVKFLQFLRYLKCGRGPQTHTGAWRDGYPRSRKWIRMMPDVPETFSANMST